jgi:hypothetical protein
VPLGPVTTGRAPATAAVAAGPTPPPPPPTSPAYPDDTGVVPQVDPGHSDDSASDQETGQVPAVTVAGGDTGVVPQVDLSTTSLAVAAGVPPALSDPPADDTGVVPQVDHWYSDDSRSNHETGQVPAVTVAGDDTGSVPPVRRPMPIKTTRLAMAGAAVLLVWRRGSHRSRRTPRGRATA